MDISLPVWLAPVFAGGLVAQAIAALAWGVRTNQAVAMMRERLAELEHEHAQIQGGIAGVRERLTEIETNVRWIRELLERQTRG